MRMSSLLMAAMLVVSLSACTNAMGTNFSGIPMDLPSQRLAQYPADPPVQMRVNQAQASPYDSSDFVVPPYLIQP